MGKEIAVLMVWLRAESGLTRAEFSAHVGVTRQTLHHYEKGDTRVPLVVFLRACDTAGVDRVHALFRLEKATSEGTSSNAGARPVHSTVPASEESSSPAGETATT